MKTVKCKDGQITFICKEESTLFNKIEMEQFVPVSTMTEREQYLCNEMYTKNVLRKVRRKGDLGYKIYPQKQAI